MLVEAVCRSVSTSIQTVITAVNSRCGFGTLVSVTFLLFGLLLYLKQKWSYGKLKVRFSAETIAFASIRPDSLLILVVSVCIMPILCF